MDSEFSLDGGTKRWQVTVAAEPPEPGLDIEERGSEPSLFLV